MSTRTALILASSAFAVYASAGAAMAQPAGHNHDQMERREVRIVRHGGPEMMAMNPQAQADHLGALLQLRPDQDGALKAFIAAGSPMHPPMEGGMAHAKGDGPPRTTPERLAMMESHMAQHQAAMKTRFAATRAFYAQLDDKQKKAFDALPPMMTMGHGGGPMMMGGHPMPIMHQMPMAPGGEPPMAPHS